MKFHAIIRLKSKSQKKIAVMRKSIQDAKLFLLPLFRRILLFLVGCGTGSSKRGKNNIKITMHG